jgi:hypothetical protein
MDVLTFVAFIIDRTLVLGLAFFIWKKKNLISGFLGFKSEKSEYEDKKIAFMFGVAAEPYPIIGNVVYHD